MGYRCRRDQGWLGFPQFQCRHRKSNTTDNASSGEYNHQHHSGRWLLGRRERGSIRWLRSEENTGFCAGNNTLAAAARGHNLVLLNNDTHARQDWLAALTDALAAAPADVAAPKNRNARFPIPCEHPVLAHEVFKVADGMIVLLSVHDPLREI